MQFNDNRGFTLLELLIGMLIMTLLLGAIFQILTISIKTYQYNMALSHNKMEIRNAINQITDELRYATEITNPEFVNKQNPPNESSRIEYVANTQSCSIAIGTGGNANTIVISGVHPQTLANGMVQRLRFSRHSTVINEVTISITVNDHSFIGSPDTTLDTIVIIPNLH